jgi:SAM-dependent methyltransferase
MSILEERVARVAYDYELRDKEPVERCNLCGSSVGVEVSRRDRYGFRATLLVCPRCGLGWLSPRLTADEYARFYAEIYRPLVSAYHARTIDAVTVQEEQRDYAVELREFLRGAVPGPVRTILDVGGSTGVVSGLVSEAFGARVTVLDPAPDELEVARGAGMETVTGFAEDFDPGGRTWDLVLLCQTIDHLLDVAATVQALGRMLAPDGRAFVDVLDFGYMMRRRGAVEGAVKVDHPYYLTRDTAVAFFALAGLEVAGERLSDDGHWGFVLARGAPREPDWELLEAGARRLLEEAWGLRARGR